MGDADTTLPLDWPPLREEALRAARETRFEVVNSIKRMHSNSYGQALIDSLPSAPIEIDAHVTLLAALTRPASRDFWARWLAEKVGLTCGATAPAWTYTPGNPPNSVACWTLSCGQGQRWALCDYPPDIERVLGPPVPYQDMISIRSLPTNPAAALRAALLAVKP